MKTGLKINPQRVYTWEQWVEGRAKRRAISRFVAPYGTRRVESSADKRLRREFDNKRGPEFPASEDNGKQG